MEIKEFAERIKSELNYLPGEKAQLKMAPVVRLPDFKTHETPIEAGVLIFLFEFTGEISLVLIKRNAYPGPHSRQISLPGGKYEHTDKDIVETAIREAHEEIGIDINKLTIMGRLTPLYIPVSNFKVTPVIGYCKESPEFIADRSEVEEIIIISINDLLDKKNESSFHFSRKGKKIKAPCYLINNHKIWGATAMMLSEFIEIVKKITI